MNNIELYIVFKDITKRFNCESHSVSGDTLEEVLSKLPLLVIKILREKHEQELKSLIDDDIPF